MRWRPLALFMAVLPASLLAGCGGTSPRAAREELLAVDTRFSEEVATRGIPALEDYYAEDAVEMPAFSPMVEGKKAVIELYRPFYKDSHSSLTWKPTRAEVSKEGDLGFTIGHYEVTRIDDAGATIKRRGKYVTVWRREWDGRWRVVLDSGSPDEPPAPPPNRPAPAPPDGGAAAAPSPGQAPPAQQRR